MRKIFCMMTIGMVMKSNKITKKMETKNRICYDKNKKRVEESGSNASTNDIKRCREKASEEHFPTR